VAISVTKIMNRVIIHRAGKRA